MDIDDELAMHVIMQEEDDIDVEEDESIAIIACITKIQIEANTNANPKLGGSKFGRWKSKLRMGGRVISFYTAIILPKIQDLLKRILVGEFGLAEICS